MSQPLTNDVVGGGTTSVDATIVVSTDMSFSSLITRHYHTLRGRAYQLVRYTGHCEPDDVLQVACIAAQRSNFSWETDDHFIAWMYKNMQQRQMDLHRQVMGRTGSSRSKVSGALVSIHRETASASGEFDRSSADAMLWNSGLYTEFALPVDSAQLQRIITHLHAKRPLWAQVITHQFIFDRTFPEIAVQLSLGYNTIHHASAMALKYIRKNLLSPEEAKAELDSRLNTHHELSRTN